jgi:hypothetical protein
MSERDESGWHLAVIALVVAVFFLAGCCQQYARWIADLQRRVAVLESERR